LRLKIKEKNDYLFYKTVSRNLALIVKLKSTRRTYVFYKKNIGEKRNIKTQAKNKYMDKGRKRSPRTW